MKITKEIFLNYYNQGKSDAEIAKLSGDCETTINKLRNSLNLKSNKMKIVSDEDLLELYYKGKTDNEIANITGCSSAQVVRRRKKYNLSPNKKKNILDDCFLDLYNSGYNDNEISKSTGISKSVVNNYRNKLNLPSIGKHCVDKNEIEKFFNEGKTDEEIGSILNITKEHVKKLRLSLRLLRSEHKRPSNYVYNNEEFQVILGSLLGDGSLVKYYASGGTILKITHCAKQLEYLKFKQQILKNNCSDIKEYRHYDDRRVNPDYSDYTIYTYSTITLNELYNNWYRPIKTIVEEDLYKLEPLGLAIWYMDDGYKCKPYGGAMLCTNAFTKQELILIQKMFKDKFQINVMLNCQSDNLIYIPSSEFNKFKKIIEPYIVDCMKYKL